MAGIFDMTGFLTPVIEKLANYIPDPAAKAKAQAEATTEMLNFVTAQNSAQLAVDQAEAGNKAVFVAGWRPFVGWACGSAFAWGYVGQPMAAFVLTAFGDRVTLPTLDLSGMMPVLLGMLGLGAMRTVEKIQGVGNGH
jgi:hypothetical protein